MLLTFSTVNIYICERDGKPASHATSDLDIPFILETERSRSFIMYILRFSSILVVFNVLLAASLPDDLFFADDTPELDTLSWTDDDLDLAFSDWSDSSLGLGLDVNENDLFNTPAAPDDMFFGDSLASTQPSSPCQADNDLFNVLQGRDTDSSICKPEQ